MQTCIWHSYPALRQPGLMREGIPHVEMVGARGNPYLYTRLIPAQRVQVSTLVLTRESGSVHGKVVRYPRVY